jgi:transposase
MAKNRMPEEFYDLVAPLLPPEQPPGRQGGRPRIAHAIVLRVIWYVLASGERWKEVPLELGCCGETARRRLQAWELAGIWDQVHQLILSFMNAEGLLHPEIAIIDTAQVRAFGGGDETGPSPVDRRKKGTKFTLVVDRDGVPLVLSAAPANRSDHAVIVPAVNDIPTVGGKPGRPVQHPHELYADAGFDSQATRDILRWLGIEPHIRRSREPHGSHLGRVRWVVERTISWIKGLRRMRVRYDRSATSINAWTSLAAAVICLHLFTEATK